MKILSVIVIMLVLPCYSMHETDDAKYDKLTIQKTHDDSGETDEHEGDEIIPLTDENGSRGLSICTTDDGSGESGSSHSADSAHSVQSLTDGLANFSFVEEEKLSEPIQKTDQLTDAKHQIVQKKYVEEYHRIKQESYELTKALMQAIINAHLDGDNGVTHILADGWNAQDYFTLKPSHKKLLKSDFAAPLIFMKDKWPCSPIWVALEWVIKSKEDKESDQIYKNRVEILKRFSPLQLRLPQFIDEHNRDQRARENRLICEVLPLRKDTPRCLIWLLCCCFASCIGDCIDVCGSPIHRAVQADNVDAFKIFMDFDDIIELHDSRGWSPMHYAARFNAHKILEHLINSSKKISFANGKWDSLLDLCEGCCTTPNCLACCSGDEKTKELLRLLKKKKDE